MRGVILYGQKEQTEEEKADSNFMAQVNMIADSFDLKIDWETTDVFKRQMNFKGRATDEQIINFLSRLQQILKTIYGEDAEMF